MARVLKEAATEFRRNEPRLDERVEGFVIQLDRPPEKFDGSATLRVVLDGRQRHVQVKFEQGAYSLVLKAHGERVAVSLDGDIYPRGQQWELRNPRNLRLLTGPADAEGGEP
jgi:sulfur carrier protein ThiS